MTDTKSKLPPTTRLGGHDQWHEPLTDQHRRALEWLLTVLERASSANFEQSKWFNQQGSYKWVEARDAIRGDTKGEGCGFTACVIGHAIARMDEFVDPDAVDELVAKNTPDSVHSMADDAIHLIFGDDHHSYRRVIQWIADARWSNPYGGEQRSCHLDPEDQLVFALWRVSYALEHGWPGVFGHRRAWTQCQDDWSRFA